jgi:hypothetical protein
MNKQIELSYLFDPTVYNSKQSFADYIKKQKITESKQKLKEAFERMLLLNLKRIGCLLFKRMQLSQDYVVDTKDQVIETFFSQDLFKKEVQLDKGNIEDQLVSLFSKLNIAQLSLHQCIQDTKSLKIDFGSYVFTSTNINTLNRILTYIGSRYSIITSVTGLWLRFMCVELTAYKKSSNSFIVKKEHFVSPTVNPTLAALTINKKVYLRQSTFKFMYDMKWKYHYENSEQFSSFFSIDSYVISTIFQQKAVESRLSLAEAEFEKQITSTVMENVVYHEDGHLIMNEFLDLETVALMKSFKLYPLSIFESCDEILADCAPSHNDLLGTLVGISKIAETNEQLAIDMFFTYLSDTWFFDTTSEDMYEYSEMIHLVMLRYFDVKTKSINFSKMQTDFDLNNPRSFLTKFVTTMNTLIREFRLYLKKQTYVLANQKKTYGWLVDFAEKEIKEKIPHASPDSMLYHNQFWSRIILLVKSFLTDKSKLDSFCTHSKTKLYKILFRLTTKDTLKPQQAREYIMTKYKEILPHYINENPFENSLFK